MISQRFFLYTALAFVLYMIWLTWQKEHATPPPVASVTQPAPREETAAPAEDLPDVQVPSVAEVRMPEEPEAPRREIVPSRHVQVSTDVMEVLIDTRGGDIRQLDLPTYPVSLKRKDEPFRLLHSDNAGPTLPSPACAMTASGAGRTRPGSHRPTMTSTRPNAPATCSARTRTAWR